MSTQQPNVGFVGLGVMGTPMVGNILAAGVAARVRVHGRGRGAQTGEQRYAALLEAGAHWAANPQEVLAGADIVISMLPDLGELEEFLAETDPMAWADGAVLVIASTSSPLGVRALADRVGGRPAVVDAPVSGGEDGALAGTLSIMVGGSDGDVERVRPVLEACGNPVHLGPIGAGQVAKACNQLIVSATVLALGEAAVLAARSGIDVARMFELFAGGYAGSRILDTRGPRIAAEDYRRSGVARYMIKDLDFAAAVAEATGTAPALLPAVREAFIELTEAGHGDADISVTRRFVEQRGGSAFSNEGD